MGLGPLQLPGSQGQTRVSALETDRELGLKTPSRALGNWKSSHLASSSRRSLPNSEAWVQKNKTLSSKKAHHLCQLRLLTEQQTGAVWG